MSFGLSDCIVDLVDTGDTLKANKKAHDNLPLCCQHLNFKEDEL